MFAIGSVGVKFLVAALFIVAGATTIRRAHRSAARTTIVIGALIAAQAGLGLVWWSLWWRRLSTWTGGSVVHAFFSLAILVAIVMAAVQLANAIRRTTPKTGS
jgi:hypothetical protein